MVTRTVTLELPEPVEAALVSAARDRGVSEDELLGSLVRERYDPSATDRDLRATFQELVARWRREIGPTSSMTDIVTSPAYQRIIGMGRPAIPLLLDELRRQPNHWFWALQSITGEDPVPPEHRGRLSLMAQDWLWWGDKNGYA